MAKMCAWQKAHTFRSQIGEQFIVRYIPRQLHHSSYFPAGCATDRQNCGERMHRSSIHGENGKKMNCGAKTVNRSRLWRSTPARYRIWFFLSLPSYFCSKIYTQPFWERIDIRHLRIHHGTALERYGSEACVGFYVFSFTLHCTSLRVKLPQNISEFFTDGNEGHPCSSIR